jgi:hypothetical protein
MSAEIVLYTSTAKSGRCEERTMYARSLGYDNWTVMISCMSWRYWGQVQVLWPHKDRRQHYLYHSS